MTPREFDELRAFLRRRSGHVLAGDNAYFAESRLAPLLGEFGFASLGELIAGIGAAGADEFRTRVVEALCVHESFFFRDKTPFMQFESVMAPPLLESRRVLRRIRIWCAAAATGQEPYSIAMQVREMGNVFDGWRVEIVATDLSRVALARARSGRYSQFEVQRGLSIRNLMKYFKQDGTGWVIDPELQANIDFRPVNLTEDFSSLGRFDLVFCRNVLIYFDRATKRDILARMAKRVMPDGYFVVGASESLLDLTDAFTAVADQRGLYRPVAGKVGLFPAIEAAHLSRPAAMTANARV